MPLAEIFTLGGAAAFTRAHTLGTATPGAEFYERLAGGWRQMVPTEYDLRFPDAWSFTATFPSILPAVGAEGSVRLQLSSAEALVTVPLVTLPVGDGLGGQLLALRAQAQAQLEALFPALIEIAGLTTAPVACAGGTLRATGAQLMSGGLIGDYDLAFRVRRSLLTGTPEVGRRLIFAGQPWRIMRVTDPANDVVFVLACDNPAK